MRKAIEPIDQVLEISFVQKLVCIQARRASECVGLSQRIHTR